MVYLYFNLESKLNALKKRIVENIAMDLRSKGIEVEKAKIKKLISSTLSQEEFNEDIFSELVWLTMRS